MKCTSIESLVQQGWQLNDAIVDTVMDIISEKACRPVRTFLEKTSEGVIFTRTIIDIIRLHAMNILSDYHDATETEDGIYLRGTIKCLSYLHQEAAIKNSFLLAEFLQEELGLYLSCFEEDESWVAVVEGEPNITFILFIPAVEYALPVEYAPSVN